MIESHELGKKAEALAGEYLQKNGYRIHTVTVCHSIELSTLELNALVVSASVSCLAGY